MTHIFRCSYPQVEGERILKWQLKPEGQQSQLQHSPLFRSLRNLSNYLLHFNFLHQLYLISPILSYAHLIFTTPNERSLTHPFHNLQLIIMSDDADYKDKPRADEDDAAAAGSDNEVREATTRISITLKMMIRKISQP